MWNHTAWICWQVWQMHSSPSIWYRPVHHCLWSLESAQVLHVIPWIAKNSPLPAREFAILGQPLVPMGTTQTIPLEMWRESEDFTGATSDKQRKVVTVVVDGGDQHLGPASGLGTKQWLQTWWRFAQHGVNLPIEHILHNANVVHVNCMTCIIIIGKSIGELTYTHNKHAVGRGKQQQTLRCEDVAVCQRQHQHAVHRGGGGSGASVSAREASGQQSLKQWSYLSVMILSSKVIMR